METRNIALTLEKAREWYNCGGADLREIALQAFTEEELTTFKFTDIKTFEDACNALDLDMEYAKGDLYSLEHVEENLSNHLTAVYKLDIIRKALNGDWKPNLVQGSVYYPYIRFYPADEARKVVSKDKELKLGESFIADGEKYTLVGGDCTPRVSSGLACFGCGYGAILPTLGLLGCKSQEIAEHMSRYFSKEIFEATYAHHVGIYQWI